MAAVAAVGILLLSGCVKFQADLTVTADDTLNGTIVVATMAGDDSDKAQGEASERADAIEQRLLPQASGAFGVTREAFEDDGYFGTKLTFADSPIDVLDGSDSEGSLSLVREGDEFVFAGTLNFSPDSDEPAPEDADRSGISVAITFPGEVTEHNGDLSGTQVTWNTSFEESLDMSARASAVQEGPPAWTWWVVGVVALAIVGLVVVVLLSKRRRGAGS